jgi:hypothetical protein
MFTSTLLKTVLGFKTIKISTERTDVNLFTLAGSPTRKGKFKFIITADTIIGQTTAAAAAIVVGQFPSGSEIQIWNYGSIQGRGGQGGVFNGGPVSGGAGGDAIYSSYVAQTVKLYNYGEIRAGGGGGGSGGYGGAGGIGGYGGIYYTSPWYWYHDNENHSQWVYYTTPGINEVAWTNDPVAGGASSADLNYSRYVADGQLLWPYGLFERGDYRGEYNDSPLYGHYYSYNVRLNWLYGPGAPAGRTAGGNGGNGQGYRQAATAGSNGVPSQPGANGTGGSGAGGASGQAGNGGAGGAWATVGSPGGYGSQGGTGGDGVYRTLPEVNRFGEGGSVSGSAGPAGRAIIKGSSTFTIMAQGTIVGAVV